MGGKGEVLLVDGTPIQTIIDRITGCRNVAKNYPDIKIVGQQWVKDWSATEIVFHQIIEAHLDWIDGVEPFIEVNKIGIECGGSVISVLQENPLFMTAMQLGGNDFLSAGQVGFFPQGLFKLRLIAGGSESE